MYRNILIATDGSELAHKAVSHGLSLAKAIGAKVTAIIVETPFSIFDVPESGFDQMSDFYSRHMQLVQEHATKVLGRIATEAQKIGVPWEVVQIENAQPHQAIIMTAEDKKCDLIVMASHGRGGVSAILLGSVTNKVLTHTKLPVLVCH